MTLKEPHYLTEQGYKNLIKLQVQYEKVVEQNKQLQAELREKTAECEKLRKGFSECAFLMNDNCNHCANHSSVWCTADYCNTARMLDITDELGIKKAKGAEND